MGRDFIVIKMQQPCNPVLDMTVFQNICIDFGMWIKKKRSLSEAWKINSTLEREQTSRGKG